MTKEAWKEIYFLKGYEVSSKGDIRRVRYTIMRSNGRQQTFAAKKMALIVNMKGYIVVGIRNKSYIVHPIVAKVFLPNPLKLPCVNHKDGNKTNNSTENLEWCTFKHNVKHSFDTGLKIPAKGIQLPKSIQVAKMSNNKIIAVYGSIREAAIANGISFWSFRYHFDNKTTPLNGFFWKKISSELYNLYQQSKQL